MTQWQAGMRITAGRLNNFDPVAVTATATPATGWSLTSFTARKAAGTTEWTVILSRTGAAITAGSTGNIGDTNVCTLPSGTRPGTRYLTQFDTGGVASGGVRIETDGVCAITSMDPGATIAVGQSLSISASLATG